MSDSIRFILNGKLVEVADLPPTTTLLQYLRLEARLTGTKEGCAEGDCGACTVAVGKLVKGKVEYQSMNACILFLPTLDGREVVTVEHLKSASGTPNPVQQAMVKCHGSQCGFCTPGFVMALSTMVNNKKNASEDDIQDAIAGNLCRCTGYRPIVDAARMANESAERALPSHPKELGSIQHNRLMTYDVPGGKYFSPASVEDLAMVLSVYPDATILAGGTDVGLWVTKFHIDLPVIIYTGNVVELRQIRESRVLLEIGAAVTYTEAFDALAAFDPSMEDLLKRFSSLHIRNAGTVGGNIANGSPIGDGPPPLIALGAKVVLRSKSGTRMVEMEDFFIAYKKQDRKAGEFVEKLVIPKRPDNVLFRVYKLSKRFDQDISAVCGAFALTIEDDEIVAARIAFGGMAGTPHRAHKAERALVGRAWNDEAVEKAMAALDDDYQPMSDARASAEYRRTTARNLLKRFYIETTDPTVKTRLYRYAE
ncbi:MAG: xanthine dehydrogenase small subunit [bacterium]|nr:xanthine dehydrogenase small subunit [bacterium]